MHIHTVLSPCTEISDMTPQAIVQAAVKKGLDMIAVSDHNSARNVAATVRAAKATGVTVIPGIEITSSEEVHILGLFETTDAALAMQDEVYARLFGQNNEDVFGYQAVVDEHDMVEDLDERLLIGATTIPTDRLAAKIRSLGGLAIASHVDRPGFGIFSQLGFIPDDIVLDALEVSKHSDFASVTRKYRQCGQYTLITSSDAHVIEDIGCVATEALMASPSFEELKKALHKQDGRRIPAKD